MDATTGPHHIGPNESTASTAPAVAAATVSWATIMSFYSGVSAFARTGTNVITYPMSAVITSPKSAVCQGAATGTGTGEDWSTRGATLGVSWRVPISYR